jgi:hypothetical protein
VVVSLILTSAAETPLRQNCQNRQNLADGRDGLRSVERGEHRRRANYAAGWLGWALVRQDRRGGSVGVTPDDRRLLAEAMRAMTADRGNGRRRWTRTEAAGIVAEMTAGRKIATSRRLAARTILGVTATRRGQRGQRRGQ